MSEAKPQLGGQAPVNFKVFEEWHAAIKEEPIEM